MISPEIGSSWILILAWLTALAIPSFEAMSSPEVGPSLSPALTWSGEPEAVPSKLKVVPVSGMPISVGGSMPEVAAPAEVPAAFVAVVPEAGEPVAAHASVVPKAEAGAVAATAVVPKVVEPVLIAAPAASPKSGASIPEVGASPVGATSSSEVVETYAVESFPDTSSI